MSSYFLRDYSLKTFENEEQSTDEKNAPYHLPNFFTHASEHNENNSEVWFRSHQKNQQSHNKNSENSLKRMNYSSYMSLNKNQIRKPLNDILKSNKDSSVQEILSKSKVPKQKPFYKALVTEGNQMNLSKIKAMTTKKSQSKQRIQNNLNNLNYINQFYQKNQSLNRLKQSVRHIKTLQQEVKKGSRSRSNKKKGLQCTLYERSLEKKINESGIKSTKKLITVKKRFEKTETEWGADSEVPQKDIKRILLKKKQKEENYLNQPNCFNSIALQKSKEKKISVDRNRSNLGALSRPKIGENIRSVSRNKKQAYEDLGRSMNLILQQCKNQQPTTRARSTSKSLERPKLSSIKKRLQSEYKTVHSLRITLPTETKGQKIIMNDKIRSNLDKIHEKYKFILNYLTDFDIIGKLNGYEIEQVDECKWILLVIDDVYEMIKRSQQTKLKGIEHSRQYGWGSGKKEQALGDEGKCV